MKWIVSIFSYTRRSYGTQGVKVVVQSNREPKYLDARIELFMQSMREYIEGMKEEEFETNKQGLKDKRLEKPKTMSGRSQKYWNEIYDQQYNFNRDVIETKVLKDLEKKDVLEFFDTYICHKSETRKKLSCYIVPSDTSEIKVEAISELEVDPEEVSDINSFKSSLSLFSKATTINDPDDMVRQTN